MALYLGSDKIKVSIDGVDYYLNFFSKTPITNGIRLLSCENYILKDSSGLYITVEEVE